MHRVYGPRGARSGARVRAPPGMAFRRGKSVGAPDYKNFVAQWLACTSPCQRFGPALADDAT